MRLRDQVALITGGGSGIGRAMAILFAAEEASVVAVDKIAASAKETAALVEAAGGRAIGVVADVSQAGDVEAMAASAMATFGRIDLLVNNAGRSIGDAVHECDEATWDLNVDVVLKGVYLCSRAVLPQMLARRRGVILNIASVNGMTAIGEAAYSAAKAGVINLTANMAIHYGDRGIRVNCISPGTVRTPIWDERVAKNPEVFNRLAKWYPLGRIGEAEDVARAALFLCSDDAAWITGINLPVDGGLTCGSFRFRRDVQGLDE